MQYQCVYHCVSFLAFGFPVVFNLSLCLIVFSESDDVDIVPISSSYRNAGQKAASSSPEIGFMDQSSSHSRTRVFTNRKRKHWSIDSRCYMEKVILQTCTFDFCFFTWWRSKKKFIRVTSYFTRCCVKLLQSARALFRIWLTFRITSRIILPQMRVLQLLFTFFFCADHTFRR